jgi:hypothetical protein
MNIRKSEVNDKKYENSKFEFVNENTPVEIFRALDERNPPLKIEIMYMIHLAQHREKREFCLPEKLIESEKQALKNLVFIYGMSTQKFKEVDEDNLSDKLEMYSKLNIFDTMIEFFNVFEEENKDTMNIFNDYSSIREQELSDQEILNAFLYFIDPNITDDDLQQFRTGFRELIIEIKKLKSSGFFKEETDAQNEKFYELKALDILYEFVECIDADTILSSHKREIRKEIDFMRNLADNIMEFDRKLDYEHLPIVDQVLLMAPLITLVKNYLKFVDGYAETEDDLAFIHKTGPVPKYHQFAFIQTLNNKLSQVELDEKTKHKLVRILNILSNLTKTLGEKFEEITSYDLENIDKILRKTI